MQVWATAIELAPMVDVWGRIMDEHVADDTGRCRACTRGGTGYRSEQWPCVLFSLAMQARTHYERTRGSA